MTEQDYLNECLNYNPVTGKFTWLERPRNHFIDSRSWKIWNSRFANKEAGTAHQQGYTQIMLDKHPHYAHRLAWVVMTGSLPEYEIDHIDHNRNNNSWDNLRSVTREENCKNQTMSIKNTSGITGVSWSKSNNNWRADVQTKHGRFAKHFASFHEAAQSVLTARQEREFHVNHGVQP